MNVAWDPEPAKGPVEWQMGVLKQPAASSGTSLSHGSPVPVSQDSLS